MTLEDEALDAPPHGESPAIGVRPDRSPGAGAPTRPHRDPHREPFRRAPDPECLSETPSAAT